MFFSGKQLGLAQEETLVVFYTRGMPRKTVRTTWNEVEMRKKFSPWASILFSTESEETDWRKSLNSPKASLATKAIKSIAYCEQDEKYRRVIIDIIPCVVVTRLETAAFIAIVAYVDKLMVRATSARGREEGTQGAVAALKKKKKRRRLCNTKIRSNEHHSVESWRIGNERFGGTHLKFSGCTWYKIEFGKERGNLEALSKKVNLMSEILARLVLRNNHLRKPHDKQIVSAK